MKAAELLDTVEQQVQNPSSRRIPVDRLMLLNWLGQEVAVLAGDEFDFLMRRLDPMILTTAGTRSYPLPQDFGINFVFGGGDSGNRFLCKLNNGTTESFLDYESPAEFFSRSFEDQAQGVPSVYTILSSKGQRELWLSPLPDTNSDSNYTVNGLYIPTEWSFEEEDELPPVPANAAVLRFALLKRTEPGNGLWLSEHSRAFNQLMVHAQRSRRSRLFVVQGEEENVNDYELI